jgi:ATP-dependent RNA helicase RhlE
VNFDEFKLDSRLLAGVRKLGYTVPTPIQVKVIPVAIAGQDLIGTAQTGTGKTAAFVLPMLNKLLTGPRRRARALIVTPTRELAEQIHEAIRDLATGTGIRSCTIYGGVGAANQVRALRDGVEILVACPGRRLDHIGQGNARLDGIEVLVLDEADRMLDMGFLPDVKRILTHIPAKRQTMLFSATFPKEIEQLASHTLKNPQRIAIGISRPAHTVAHALYPVPQHLKSALVLEILRRTDTESVLIFTRTKHRAEKLSRQIGQAGIRATSLHSDRSQGQRQSALNGFKSGEYQVMVATDIAARGLDVEHISHVINFDMPATADDYIHRIGRTGRAEHTGDAFTLVTPDDRDMIRELEKIMGKPLPRQTLDGFDYDIPAPEIPPSRGKPAFRSRVPQAAPSRPAHKPAQKPAQKPDQKPARRPGSNRNFRQKYAGGKNIH